MFVSVSPIALNMNRRASPQRKHPADAAVDKLAQIIQAAKTVAIFGGDGCRNAKLKSGGVVPSNWYRLSVYCCLRQG
jgi:hypothetical protein